MAIAKRPQRYQIDIHAQEKAANQFIAGAEKPAKREKKTPVLIRFDPRTLRRVDEAAGRKGISRSAWIHFMVSHALEQEED